MDGKSQKPGSLMKGTTKPYYVYDGKKEKLVKMNGNGTTRPYHVYDGKNDRLVKMTLEEFRAMPVTHLEPGYRYPHSTYDTYDGSTGAFIVHEVGGKAAASVSDRESSTLRQNSSLKLFKSAAGQSSTSKSKSKDKGKSVAT